MVPKCLERKGPAEAGPSVRGYSLRKVFGVFRSGATPGAGLGSTKKRPRRATGLKADHGARGLNGPHPFMFREPARPNWGGGRSLLGYNSLGHKARPPVLHHGLPKFRLTDHNTSAGLSA
jgi:hypothetical protein